MAHLSAVTLAAQETVTLFDTRMIWILILANLAFTIFSIIMLINCLSRPADRFPRTFSSTGENEKVIWALIIFFTMGLIAAGAIAYFFMVLNGSPPRRPAGRGRRDQYAPRPQPQYDPYAHPYDPYAQQHYDPYGQSHPPYDPYAQKQPPQQQPQYDQYGQPYDPHFQPPPPQYGQHYQGGGYYYDEGDDAADSLRDMDRR